MAFCVNCGAELKKNAKFCHKCGTETDIEELIFKDDRIKLDGIDIPKFVPPKDNNPNNDINIPTFSPPEDNNPSGDSDIPIFSPPGNNNLRGDINIPNFDPPKNTRQHFDGPACYHHPNLPAAGTCARCGKYVCEDCMEAYTVIDGEYANKCLCYDCCEKLVSDNVELLQSQKRKITTMFIGTGVCMAIGALLFASTGSIIGILFGMFWIGSFWNWVKSSFSGWWNGTDRSLGSFIGSCIGAAIVSPIFTIRKIIYYIRYLNETSHFIEQDSAALEQMREYLEYTTIMSQNVGMNLEDLMSEGSALYDNSYAQAVRSQGEEAADAMLRQYTTRIAENGEIIRGFAA